jgi:hypothetical protein
VCEIEEKDEEENKIKELGYEILDILQEIEEKLIEPEKNPNFLIDPHEPPVEYCPMAFI